MLNPLTQQYLVFRESFHVTMVLKAVITSNEN